MRHFLPSFHCFRQYFLPVSFKDRFRRHLTTHCGVRRNSLTPKISRLLPGSVGSKNQQRWLWHAINHRTGQVLAYVFGAREDHVFLKLKALLQPFGITRFYTDGWGAYRRHIDPAQHTVGKQHTQKIERKHTTLRARIKRLVRKTICFSKSIQMHDLVIGLLAAPG